MKITVFGERREIYSLNDSGTEKCVAFFSSWAKNSGFLNSNDQAIYDYVYAVMRYLLEVA